MATWEKEWRKKKIVRGLGIEPNLIGPQPTVRASYTSLSEECLYVRQDSNLGNPGP